MYQKQFLKFLLTWYFSPGLIPAEDKILEVKERLNENGDIKINSYFDG